VKNDKLSIPEFYLHALEEMTGLDLSAGAVKTKLIRKLLEKYAEACSALSFGLTRNKQEFLREGYLDSKEARDAYLVYFTTTNLLKGVPPLREFYASNGFCEFKELRVLDLGCGAGAATWGLLAFLDEISSAFPLSLTFADIVKENLAVCRKFLSHSEKGVSIDASYIHTDLSGSSLTSESLTVHSPYQLIMMMNTLNELPEENDETLLQRLFGMLDTNGAIIIVEPASREESRRLLRFRDRAVGRGLTVYSPCTHQNNCPALIKDADWCHTEIEWERPEFIALIDEKIGNLRLSLKSSYVVLTKNGNTLSKALDESGLSRIVSEVFIEKGRRRAFLCNDSGRNEYVLNLRDKTPANSDFVDSQRYDLVKVSGEEPREHDRKITESSDFRIVLPHSGAREPQKRGF
jgi:ribosomal protein RSM22 (predicted rRNA methylase)